MLRFEKTSGLIRAPFVVSDCAFWCFIVLSEWTCWCSVLGKRLVSLVLRWSLVVLSGASFRLFDCGLSLDFLVVGVWQVVVVGKKGFERGV